MKNSANTFFHQRAVMQYMYDSSYFSLILHIALISIGNVWDLSIIRTSQYTLYSFQIILNINHIVFVFFINCFIAQSFLLLNIFYLAVTEQRHRRFFYYSQFQWQLSRSCGSRLKCYTDDITDSVNSFKLIKHMSAIGFWNGTRSLEIWSDI